MICNPKSERRTSRSLSANIWLNPQSFHPPIFIEIKLGALQRCHRTYTDRPKCKVPCMALLGRDGSPVSKLIEAASTSLTEHGRWRGPPITREALTRSLHGASLIGSIFISLRVLAKRIFFPKPWSCLRAIAHFVYDQRF